MQETGQQKPNSAWSCKCLGYRHCCAVSDCDVSRAARAGSPLLIALLQNAGGKTTPWMALIIEDLHALRAREGWKLSELPEFSADPRS